MPLAIIKRKASELPISFTLDDSTAMTGDGSCRALAADRDGPGVSVWPSHGTVGRPGRPGRAGVAGGDRPGAHHRQCSALSSAGGPAHQRRHSGRSSCARWPRPGRVWRPPRAAALSRHDLSRLSRRYRAVPAPATRLSGVCNCGSCSASSSRFQWAIMPRRRRHGLDFAPAGHTVQSGRVELASPCCQSAAAAAPRVLSPAGEHPRHQRHGGHQLGDGRKKNARPDRRGQQGCHRADRMPGCTIRRSRHMRVAIAAPAECPTTRVGVNASCPSSSPCPRHARQRQGRATDFAGLCRRKAVSPGGPG